MYVVKCRDLYIFVNKLYWKSSNTKMKDVRHLNELRANLKQIWLNTC